MSNPRVLMLVALMLAVAALSTALLLLLALDSALGDGATHRSAVLDKLTTCEML